MGRIIKIVLWFIGVVASILIIAAVAIPLIIDPNDYRDQLEQMVEAKTGRALELEGKIELSLFPWLGLEVGRMSIGNAPGFAEQIFASAEQIRLRVKLIPLIQRQVEVGAVAVQDLVLNLARDKSGKGNWEDLMERAKRDANASPGRRAEKAPDAPISPSMLAFAISGLDLTGAQVHWNDGFTGQRYTVENLSLQTGMIIPGEPTGLELSFHGKGDTPPLVGDVALTAQVEFDAVGQNLRVRDLELTADSKIGKPQVGASFTLTGGVDVDLLAQTVQTQNLRLTSKLLRDAPQVAVNATLRGDINAMLSTRVFQVRGLDIRGSLLSAVLPAGSTDFNLRANADVDLLEQTLAVVDLNLGSLGLEGSGAIAGESLLSQPYFKGSFEVAQFDLWQLLKRLGRTPGETADLGVLGSASLKTGFTASTGSVSLKPLAVKLDDTTLEGALNVVDFNGPAVRFDLAIDAIDVNRYLLASPTEPASPQAGEQQAKTGGSPGTARAKPSDGVRLEPLRDLDLQGRLRIGTFKVKKFTINNLVLPVKAKDGIIAMRPIEAKLYDGAYSGDLGLDATGQRLLIAVNDSLTGIQVGPLLKDLVGKDRLTGTANVAAKLTMYGTDAAALRASLNGTSRFAFRDGAVKGINIGRLIREANARLRGDSLPPDKEPVQTDFTELQGTFHVVDGVATSNDLAAKSPLLRVMGEGVVDLARQRLDYLLTTIIVATAEGQGGEEVQDLKGMRIPIKVTGAFEQPRFAVDLEALLREKSEAIAEEKKREIKEKAEQELEKRLGTPLPGEARDLLKKLF